MLDRGKIVERRADGSAPRGRHAHRHHADRAGRAGAARQTGRRTRQPRQEPVPLAHEPRDAHAAERGDRLSQLLRSASRRRPGQVSEYADHILRASEHLLGLVNEVLDLQRVEERPRRAGSRAPSSWRPSSRPRSNCRPAAQARASRSAARCRRAAPCWPTSAPAPGADEHGLQRGEVQPPRRLGGGDAARRCAWALRHRHRGHRLRAHRRAAGAPVPALRAPRPRAAASRATASTS